ncbi:hypothetical protein [Rhodococcus oryzae]
MTADRTPSEIAELIRADADVDLTPIQDHLEQKALWPLMRLQSLSQLNFA